MLASDLYPAAPLHIDSQGLRAWRLAGGCLVPVRHALSCARYETPLNQFLLARQDHAHVRLARGPEPGQPLWRWELTDRGMVYLASWRAPR